MKKQILIAVAFLFLIGLASLASVQAVTIKNVDVFPEEIEPGETATITINLENNLNEDVEDISVSLIFRELIRDSFGNVVSVNEIPFAPYGSSSERTLDELSENEDESLSFKVRALTDAKSGIYKIPVKITYYDEDDERHEKDSLISITLNSKPLLSVEAEDNLILKGQDNEIVIKVVNKGLSDVKFLEIEVGSSARYSLLSGSKVYIGDIDSDDFDTSKFKIFFKENVPSNVNLPVTLIYRDAVNNKYEEEFNLPLKVYNQKQAIELGLLQKSKTTTYVGVIIAVIIIYIIYRKIRKRRKLKKVEASA